MRFATALLLWVVLACAPATAVRADDDGEKVYRANALAHARALEAAHRRLQRHITEDAASATSGSWPQDVPPASTGWVRDWTDRGLRARYCADTLVVYAGREGALHGGTAQRSVQAAPRLYGPHDTRGPALHWLRRTGTTGVEAHGGAGRTSVVLPTCMTAGLPVERVALSSAVGGVPDPWVDTWVSRRADPEWRACPSGHHVPGGLTASGQRWRVVRTRTMSRHGRPIGAEAIESQTLETNHCVANYTRHECVPNAAPPPVAAARYYRVEADPSGRTRHRQFVPGPLPANPCAAITTPPTVSVVETELHRNSTCAATAGTGWTGTARDRRQRRVTTFSWRPAPVTVHTPWVPDSSDCSRRTDFRAASACPSAWPRWTGTARRIRTRTERRTRAAWSASAVVHTPTWSNWRWLDMNCTRQTYERGWTACPPGQTGRIERIRYRTQTLRKSATSAPSASPPAYTNGSWGAWSEVSRTCVTPPPPPVVVASDDSGNGPSGDPGDGGTSSGGTSSGGGTSSSGGVTGDDTGTTSHDGTGSNQGLGDPGTHDSDDSGGDGGDSGGDGGSPGDGGDGGVGGENGGAW